MDLNLPILTIFKPTPRRIKDPVTERLLITISEPKDNTDESGEANKAIAPS